MAPSSCMAPSAYPSFSCTAHGACIRLAAGAPNGSHLGALPGTLSASGRMRRARPSRAAAVAGWTRGA